MSTMEEVKKSTLKHKISTKVGANGDFVAYCLSCRMEGKTKQRPQDYSAEHTINLMQAELESLSSAVKEEIVYELEIYAPNNLLFKTVTSSHTEVLDEYLKKTTGYSRLYKIKKKYLVIDKIEL